MKMSPSQQWKISDINEIVPFFFLDLKYCGDITSQHIANLFFTNHTRTELKFGSFSPKFVEETVAQFGSFPPRKKDSL
jgi:hypothetical protein